MIQAKNAQAKFIMVMADVTKIADTNNLIEQAWSQLGGCDILVNNAGIEKGAEFWDVTEAGLRHGPGYGPEGCVLSDAGVRAQAARCEEARPRHQHLVCA